MPLLLCLAALLSNCGRLDHLGRPPTLSETQDSEEHVAMLWPGLPLQSEPDTPHDASSLWSSDQHSLLGDHRAAQRGDILTVVIEIDEKAEISNDTSRARSGSENLEIEQLFGVPQRVEEKLPDGATLGDAVDLNSSSRSGGKGSIKRRETLTIRIAATVVDVLPNGVLAINGTQEIRVNYELRDLMVSGFIRPEDISRKNEITYDKIASARVAYGGRGQITDVQQPRVGQQVLDILLPF